MTHHTISLFNRKTDATPKETVITWAELCDWLKNPIVRARKDGAAFAPSLFIPAHRLLANVTEVCWLVLDADHINDIEEVIKVFKNLRFVVYSTHSSKRVTENNPQALPCYRIVIELASPIPANLFPALWQWAQTLSGNQFDEACKDASRLHYKPAKATVNAEYEYHIFEGEPLDWRTLNLQPVTGKPPKPQKQSKKAATGPAAITIEDEKILKIARSKFGAKFERLYSGDSSDYKKKNGEPDHSRADNGFVVMLCDAGATDEQIERIWKASGRNRDKLYTHATYVQKTIDSARNWIASQPNEDLAEFESDDPPITEDKRLDKYLRQCARNTGKVLDAVRLLFLNLGFKGNHNRLLNALIRKGRDNLGAFVAKQKWLVEQYVSNGEKASSEKTISRDIRKLLDGQKALGVEVIKYWPGYRNFATGESSASKFQNLFVRYALEAIGEAIQSSEDYEYSWQALEAACQNVAARIPKTEVLQTEPESDKDTSPNAGKEKLKAIRQTEKYLGILFEQGKEVEIVEGEAQEIFFEALGRALNKAKNAEKSLSPEVDKMSGSGNSIMEVFTIQ